MSLLSESVYAFLQLHTFTVATICLGIEREISFWITKDVISIYFGSTRAYKHKMVAEVNNNFLDS